MYGIAAALLTISCVVFAARPSVRRTLAVFFGLQVRGVRKDAPVPGATPRSEPKEPKPAALGNPSPAMAPVAVPVLELPSEPPDDAPPSRRAHGGEAPRADLPEAPHAAATVAAAKDLFAQANAKRRAGDDAGAKRLYQELQLRHPQSPEAQVSYVALGRLLLERSRDPKAALEQFDRALDPSGPTDRAGLVEEALFGRATALLKLGRTADERKTWLGLLERFPGSVYADRARARLNEINFAAPRTADPATQN